MHKPIGYFASAPSGTSDNTILSEIDLLFGPYLEKLTPAQKSAWAITLITEAIEPEGVEVDYNINDVPSLEHLFSLSDSNKLALSLALINYLVYGLDASVPCF